MYKFFTTLIVALAFAATSFAQSKGTTQFGVNVGLNFANVSAGNIPNDDVRTGFNAGVSVEHYFSESWSIKSRLIYDQKGWNSGYLSDGSSTYATNYHLDYVTIPVLANWHFGRKKNWYLDFGPYLSLLLNAKESTGGVDVKDFFKTKDAGLDLGIGVKFPVSNTTKFFIELNGAAGISDIAKNNTGSTIRTSVSAVNIGFLF
jgi:hypothetical protein